LRRRIRDEVGRKRGGGGGQQGEDSNKKERLDVRNSELLKRAGGNRGVHSWVRSLEKRRISREGKRAEQSMFQIDSLKKTYFLRACNEY